MVGSVLPVKCFRSKAFRDFFYRRPLGLKPLRRVGERAYGWVKRIRQWLFEI
jgi:hypothetical protein